MSKQVLDIKQMKHLQELGLGTSGASMLWCRNVNISGKGIIYGEWKLVLNTKDAWINNAFWWHGYTEYISTFTLQDILDLLPKELGTDTKRYNLDMWYSIYINKWCVGYMYGEDMYCDGCFTGDNLIDVFYEMLCWCIKNEHIKV